MDSLKRKRSDRATILASTLVFAASAVILALRAKWSHHWFLSGAPWLTLSLLTAGPGRRLFPFIPLYASIAYVHLSYAIAATSWLFYWLFLVTCWSFVGLSCLFQSAVLQDVLRRCLRKLLRDLQFTSDKISFFDLPALEIDRDVDGLMVIRGVTISLSSLTVVAHGVEVGIKFSDDMEMALIVDTVTIKLFRRIEIGDVYGNVKGGEHEMNFHALGPNTKNSEGDALMEADILNTDTPLLQAAEATEDPSQQDKIKMTEEMTDGSAPTDKSAKGAFEDIRQLDLDDEQATARYAKTLDWIKESSLINQATEEVFASLGDHDESNLSTDDTKGMRAAVCTRLHQKATIGHPPKSSIKVTTLQNLSPPYVRRFLHRLPLLLRLLLNPVAYFHPVFIRSITAGGSGKWMKSMIESNVFKEYAEDNNDIKHLQQRISTWLSDANFCLQLVDIKGVAQVPVNVSFDILSQLKFGDVLVYRTVQAKVQLKEVVRLGGADATISVPAFLLPHHEHLLPAPPSTDDLRKKKDQMKAADGKPKTVQKRAELEQTQKDETNVTISTHIRLPACFDQELLDFIAALVKASKIVEVERDADSIIEEKTGHGALKDLTMRAKETVKHGLKKATIDMVAQDKFISKLVGKFTRKLESAQGDVGYSGNIPVALKVYRDAAEPFSKILP